MKQFIFIATFLFVSLNVSAHNAGGHGVGNGGDTYSLQFVTLAQKVLIYLQNSKVSGLNFDELSRAIETTKVESTDLALILDGMNKDAINYPSERRIVFNRQRWSALVTEEKLALVLHEYLSLLKIEDANYRISKLLLADFDVLKKIAVGRDSSWLLCQSDSLITNIFEHRAGAGTRATEVTLIFGGYTLRGTLEDAIEGQLILKDFRWEGLFTGEIKINFAESKMYLKGIMTLGGSVVEIDNTLKCVERSGN